jgi:hypothetical protein
MFSASNMQQVQFALKFPAANADRIVLESTGLLHVLDARGQQLWFRGPFGASTFYALNAEDQGDIALYNDTGAKLWSAGRDGV